MSDDNQRAFDFFSHMFCGETCLDIWVERYNIRELFGREVGLVECCINCDNSLSSDNEDGYGFNLSSIQENILYLRTLMSRGVIPNDGILLRGYCSFGGDAVALYQPYRPAYDLNASRRDAMLKTLLKNQSKNQTATSKEQTDQMKKSSSAHNSSIVARVKNQAVTDAIEVKRRTFAKQIVRGGTELLSSGVATRLPPQVGDGLKALMETSFGRALVGTLISTAENALPAEMNIPEVRDLLREIRVGALSEATDDVTEMVMGPLRSMIKSYISEVKTIETQLGGGDRVSSLPSQADEPIAATVEEPKTKATKPKVKKKTISNAGEKIVVKDTSAT